jgi:hypothetical protein
MLTQSLSKAVSELKNNWLKVVSREEITSACRSHGLNWRQRVLDPVTTIELFMLQILHSNTSITSLRYFTKRGFSAAAYCKARIRIPLLVLKALLEKMNSSIRDSSKEAWYGRRLFLVDGSNFSMPDVKSLVDHFGKPTGQKDGCGFPMAHFLALMHAGTGLIQTVLPGQLFSSDLSSFIKIHSHLNEGDVVVADRAFGSFANIGLLIAGGIDGVFRVHHRRKVDFSASSRVNRRLNTPPAKWKKKLSRNDQLVKWSKPKKPSVWMTPEQYQSLPEEIEVRELSYTIKKKGFRVSAVTLVTTLTDPKEFPATALVEAYNMRWQIETNFNHLKTTMNMNVLRCKSVDGILRELYTFCIVYNLIRTVMMNAAKSLSSGVKQISFIDAMRWLKQSCNNTCFIQILTIPLRPNRREPRAIKRRMKQYDLLIKPRKTYKSEFQNA